jgi:hypothetical protein
LKEIMVDASGFAQAVSPNTVTATLHESPVGWPQSQ